MKLIDVPLSSEADDSTTSDRKSALTQAPLTQAPLTQALRGTEGRTKLAALVWMLLILATLFVAILFSGSYFPFVSKPTSADRLGPIEAQPDLDANLPELESYLRQMELSVEGIKPGLEKGIVWADVNAPAKTELAFVYLHGFSASRRELSPVVERLSAEMNANAYFARLEAHGLKSDEGMSSDLVGEESVANGESVASREFANVRPQAWIDDAREAMLVARRLGRKVVVVGTSTGALLAVHMALDPEERFRPDALILVSPNFYPANSQARHISGPFGKWLARAFIGRERSWVPSNAAHAELWTSRYRSEGVVALMDLVHSVERLNFSLIKQPLLLIYTSHDKVVDVPLIRKRFSEFGSESKTILDLPEATRHEIASDALAPEVVAPAVIAMKSFVSQLQPKR